MAPRDGDNGMDRRPRHPAAQPVAPVDDSDGEEDDIVDDDIVDDQRCVELQVFVLTYGLV